MIQIIEKEKCCGCEACHQICPQSCIQLKEDFEGFLYPEVSLDKCTECGLCEAVCPVIHQGEPREPIKIVGAKNTNETIRRESSSGGIFTLIAEHIINDGGVVFGAKFDANWEVIHHYTETIEGLAAFRGSKYVQSRIGNSFKLAKQFLKQGRKVLFSGTPCQIAGLKLFLRKEYANLTTVDFICHGVPSPMVWRRYTAEILADVEHNNGLKKFKPYFTAINFRDKTEGWKKYSLSLTINNNGRSLNLRYNKNKNLYMRGFISDLYLRPSCHQCPSKSLKSGSDITIADFWGIQRRHPEFDDDKGVSLVIINSERGDSVYRALSLESIPTTKHALQSVLFNSAKPHPKRKDLFEKISNTQSFGDVIEQLTKISLYKHLFNKGKQITRKTLQIIF